MALTVLAALHWLSHAAPLHPPRLSNTADLNMHRQLAFGPARAPSDPPPSPPYMPHRALTPRCCIPPPYPPQLKRKGPHPLHTPLDPPEPPPAPFLPHQLALYGRLMMEPLEDHDPR